MAEITLPSFGVKSLEMFLDGADSPLEMLNRSEVIVSGPVALWNINIPLALDAATEETKRAWRSVLVQLIKLSNNFKVAMPDWPGNGASYTGNNPLVKGTGQLGTSLNCDNVTVSTLVAKDGDYLEVNGEFKVLTADPTSDVSGNVTFNFEPALRVAPPDDDPIDIKTPKATFRLLSPRGGWLVSKPDIYNITLIGKEWFSAT